MTGYRENHRVGPAVAGTGRTDTGRAGATGAGRPSGVRELPRILTVGCGGAGSHGVTSLQRIGGDSTMTAAVNTDRNDMEASDAQRMVLIGEKVTGGRGTGGDPELAARLAEAAQGELVELVGGANLVFLTAGLGGGTGTGVAPKLARIAKENGALVVALVTMPFDMEREKLARARSGLRRLREEADCVIALDNDRLVAEAGELPLDSAFGLIDDFVGLIIHEVSETISRRSVINLDFADVRRVMSLGGMGTIMWGQTEYNDPELALGEVMNNPLCDVDVRGARGALIQVATGGGLTLSGLDEIITAMSSLLAPDAHVVAGMRVDPSLGEGIRVMAIVTGLDDREASGGNAVAVLEELSSGDRGDGGSGEGDGDARDWSRWDIRMVT